MLPVAILAGGLATRLRPLTETIPKLLIDINGRPFAEHQLELLRAQGVSEIVYCVGHMGDAIRTRLGDGRAWGMRFQYVFDGDRQLGTGGALRHALPHLGGSFFVMYGDSYLPCDFTAVARAFRKSGCLGLMTVFRNEGRFDRSNVQFANGRVLRYDKVHPTPDMCHIDYGLGVFCPDALSDFADGAAFDLAAVYQKLLVEGRLAAYEVSTRFYEIGSPDGLAATRSYLAGTREMTP